VCIFHFREKIVFAYNKVDIAALPAASGRDPIGNSSLYPVEMDIRKRKNLMVRKYQTCTLQRSYRTTITTGQPAILMRADGL
jgi:hypothetical protein